MISKMQSIIISILSINMNNNYRISSFLVYKLICFEFSQAAPT